MLKISIFILVFSSIFVKIIFTTTTKVCRKTEKICSIGYIEETKRLKLYCNEAKCFGTFSYQCGKDVCAVDKKNCKNFGNLNSFHIRLLLSPVMSPEQNKMNIPSCPLFNWDSKDVCLKRDYCFTTPQTIEKKDCHCEKYDCFNKFCVSNDEICGNLMLKLIKNKRLDYNYCN